MLPEPAELAARVANLGGVLFTEFTLAGLVLAFGLAAVSQRLTDEARERLAVAASLAVVVWFAGPAATLALVAWTLAFAASVEVGVGRPPVRAVALALLGVLVAGPILA